MCDCPRNKMCACESFKAYAQACSRENVSIRWEKHILCPSKFDQKDQCSPDFNVGGFRKFVRCFVVIGLKFGVVLK